MPVVVIARWRSAQRLDAGAVVPERELRALRAVDLFAPLPLATVEARAGPVVRSMGPGESFGEIALLRDVPRTAAVLAETDGLLYVLEREQFLSAVTGQVRSAQAAEAVVDARLRASREAPPV